VKYLIMTIVVVALAIVSVSLEQNTRIDNNTFFKGSIWGIFIIITTSALCVWMAL
jgi:hypothetical protein